MPADDPLCPAIESESETETADSSADEADAALVEAQTIEEDQRAWLRDLTAFLAAMRPSRAFGGLAPMGTSTDAPSIPVQRARDRALVAAFHRVGRISRSDLKR